MASMLLSDLIAGQMSLWLWCDRCGHHGHIDPRRIMERAGDIAVPQAGHYCRCAHCGSRTVSARPDWPRRGRVARALPEAD